MNDLNLDIYLNIVNKTKKEKGLETHAPLYPMFRVENGKLFVAVMLSAEEDNVWSLDGNVKVPYWVLIDIDSKNIIEFNKTTDRDFVVGDLIVKNSLEKQKEMSKYTVEKALQYREYLINDIKNEKLPLQKRLSEVLDDKMLIDGNEVDLNDYLLSNLESDIKEKINELVDLLVQSKYGSITFYYDQLFDQIVKEYQHSGNINHKKLKLCIEIMNNYYDGVIGIDNFFNL